MDLQNTPDTVNMVPNPMTGGAAFYYVYIGRTEQKQADGCHTPSNGAVAAIHVYSTNPNSPTNDPPETKQLPCSTRERSPPRGIGHTTSHKKLNYTSSKLQACSMLSLLCGICTA